MLDLYGFRSELSRIGFGRDDGRLWLGFSGSVQLVELLPVGAAVENARVLWDPSLDVTALTPAEIVAALSFELSGLGVQYSMPSVLEFSGSAYLLNEGTIHRFGGDLRLQLPTVGLGVAAGLLVGFNTEAPPYPFLFLSLDVDLPAGVPLGQSGLALKGAAGLVGYNVFPRRTEPQNWYVADARQLQHPAGRRDRAGRGMALPAGRGHRGVGGHLRRADRGPGLA